MMNPAQQLPKMISKKELCSVFGYATTKSLYAQIITEDLVEKAGYSMSYIRSSQVKRLPPCLTLLIYERHKITSF
jgi:hypothetical protein